MTSINIYVMLCIIYFLIYIQYDWIPCAREFAISCYKFSLVNYFVM